MYLSFTPGFAEERGLGCEEGEVFALVLQAAVPAAHAVTVGHGGGHHCVDSHGEVLRRHQHSITSAHSQLQEVLQGFFGVGIVSKKAELK